ncbi:6-hydroxy-D-nicotine oxidase [Lasiodiplodia hormozganensis]|uniref:6-hydroxy-D-nicotine oxidase n=1 Tax=Lasiodiplodia hormozganensis TaxID=869390 RepID=A0AA40CH12_9PEZI|nr:6-hydroxy-D-nicotine oxidase [Lasiodiplodia hormozganensis]
MARLFLTHLLALGGLTSGSLVSAGSQSRYNSTLQSCLTAAVGGDEGRAQFPSEASFATVDVSLRNLEYPRAPAAVMYPSTSGEVAEIVKCAVQDNRKVRARSGGHDYINSGLGVVEGSVTVDMRNLNRVSVDQTTWKAAVGPGNLLADVERELRTLGGRMVPHGNAGTVGIGGHATVGGVGSSTRRSGLTLDWMREVEMVLANGSVVRASDEHNADLFWAARGAAHSFGIATEFVFETLPVPEGSFITFVYSIANATSDVCADVVKAWNALVAHPRLTRDLFVSVFIGSEAGLSLNGHFFGSRAAFDALALETVLSAGHDLTTNVSETTWASWYPATLANPAGASLLSNTHFYSRTVAVTRATLPSNASLDAIIDHVVNAGPPDGVATTFILDHYGGADNDVPPDATAFPHRDQLYYMHLIAADRAAELSQPAFHYVGGPFDLLLQQQDGRAYGVYAGYVDDRLEEPQRAYWGANLPRLERIKAQVDPADVFFTFHGVKPAVL